METPTKKAKLIRRMKWFWLIFALWNIWGIGAWSGWGTLFFRVKQEYACVFTRVNGERQIEDKVGIHFRFWSFSPGSWIFNTREVSQRMEFIYLDNNPEPHEMQAADKIKFQGAGVWTYKIVDLYKFGVQMGDKALEMLNAELNGIAKAIIQAHSIEEIVAKIEKINEKVNGCKDIVKIETKYGIKIDSFRLTHATYPKEMNEKTAEAKNVKIMAESVREAANDFAKAKERLAIANKFYLQKLIEGSGVNTEEGRKKALDVLKDINLYEMLEKRPAGGIIYVLPQSGGPNLTLPSPPVQPPSVTKEDKINESKDAKSEKNKPESDFPLSEYNWYPVQK